MARPETVGAGLRLSGIRAFGAGPGFRNLVLEYNIRALVPDRRTRSQRLGPPPDANLPPRPPGSCKRRRGGVAAAAASAGPAAGGDRPRRGEHLTSPIPWLIFPCDSFCFARP